MIPYASATAGDRAIVQLQKTLETFGCTQFGTMIDNERGVLMVQFKWRGQSVSLEASFKGYAQALLNAQPNRKWRARRDVEALAQARISVCSILRDWVKAQVTAIESGVLSFETAFMPHMLLANGQRLIDRVKSENLLPPPKGSG